MIMCKALAQCRACGSCYTKSGRQTGTFRNFFWVFVFPTCHLRGLGDAVLLSFSGIVGGVSILHETWDHLQKNGLLLIHRHKRHVMDNPNGW